MDQPNIPPTMRAWTRPSCGPSAKSLKLITNMPTPTISPDSAEILVRVSYVALQYSTETALEIIPQLPGMPVRIPEIEYSGIVVAAGSKAPAELREVGMRVNGFRSISSILLGYGVMCEYVKAMPEKLTRLPDGVGMEMAAGMLGCGSTALKMMRTAGLKGGDRILVNGASSSVGSVLVQMCKANGAFVVGVASGKNEELVRSLGVNEFIDYTIHHLPTLLKSDYSKDPFDYVFDCVGVQSLYASSPDYLKPAGAVINIGALEGSIWTSLLHSLSNTWLPTWLGGIPRRYIMFSTPPDADSAVIMAQRIHDGSVRVLIDSTWDMEDAIKAYGRVATKRARGKVIVKVT